MLDCSIIERLEGVTIIIIICNDHSIYIKIVYLDNFFILTKMNIKNKESKNKYLVTWYNDDNWR